MNSEIGRQWLAVHQWPIFPASAHKYMPASWVLHIPSPCGYAQGTKPEVRTYNTIISACNRSGQPENALRVYERMLADGAQPTATTYTALISAYGKTGKVRWSQHSPFTGRLRQTAECSSVMPIV